MKIVVFSAVAVMIALSIAGCAPKVDSDSANHDWSPAKAGVSHAQLMAEMQQAVAGRQVTSQGPAQTAASAAAAAGAKGAAPSQ